MRRKKTADPGDAEKFLNTRIFFFIGILIVFGVVFLNGTWKMSMHKTEHNALRMAMAAEAGFRKSEIKNLKAEPEDAYKPEYKQIKGSLMEIAKLDNEIAFLYIYIQKQGKIYFLADSVPPGAEGYSPPGQQFEEAIDITFQPFKEGKPFITGPATDRWGRWVSVLVPMKDPDTGEVIAVFGADYPADKWNDNAVINILQSGAIVLFLYLCIIAFYVVLRRNIELKSEKNKLNSVGEKLKESEELFKAIFEQSPVGIATGNNDYSISSVNAMFEKITGWSKEDLVSMRWTDITYVEDVLAEAQLFENLKRGLIREYSTVKRYIKPGGAAVWVKSNVVPLTVGEGEDGNNLYMIEDISDRMQAEADLKESERSKAVLLSNLPGMAYRCNYDKDWTMQFVSEGCFELTGYKKESLLYNNEISFNDLISLKYQEYLWDTWAKKLGVKEKLKEEYEIITASGETKWVFEQGQGVYDEKGRVIALEGLIIDITERKRREDEIQFLNDHDYLTGLKSRRFFEQEKKELSKAGKLPVSVIVGDINGVKLINDAFGHAEGDKLIVATAKILKGCLRHTDILARTGGDEFNILLPQTDGKTAFGILEKIKTACEEYNAAALNEAYYINISLGLSTKKTEDQDIDRIIKEAEDYMYKRKLLEHKSLHSVIISSIKATMFAKSQETEEHAERLVVLTRQIGIKLGLSQSEMDELELLATLHDIGKVGIDDRILNKPEPLNKEEWQEMRKHPEIGYRIAKASTELTSIAECVLSHHERWDGQGYPQRLRGENIPLLSRILSVVDAYDAMTTDRVYRKAVSKEDAVTELRKNAGSQFDPKIVKIFIEQVLKIENIQTI